MKFLFIIHLPPPVHGSALVGGYIKGSKEITDSFETRFINLSTSVSINDIGDNNPRKLIRYFSLLLQVIKQLLVFRPNLCYFTPTAKGPGFYKDAVVITLVKMFGLKTIYHYHNKGVSARQDRFFDNLLYRMIFNNAYVLLLSKYLYPDVQKYLPEDRVHYCPNGIPDVTGHKVHGKKIVPESGLADYSIAEILFLSHLIESKGVFVLLDALKILKGRGISFHCTMIGGEGDVSEQQMKQKIAEAGLSGNILLAGKKYGEEKQKAFEEADIFVHPSFNDCQPLVLLEAMQYSLPVVSTPEGAIPDVVENGVTGFLVPQKNAVALADKLEVLVRNPALREQMGEAGRLKYNKEFTLERFEKRMVEILNKVKKSLSKD